MVKYINNVRAKSDRHQAHERKYAASMPKKETDEQWFLRMTTPKVKPIKPPKVPKAKLPKVPKAKLANVPKVLAPKPPRVRKYSKAKLDRDRERANNFFMRHHDVDVVA